MPNEYTAVINEHIDRLSLTKADKDKAEAAYEEARTDTFDAMEAHEDDKWKGERGTASIIRGAKPVLDEEAFMAELDESQRQLVTKTVVDLKKLEQAVELGIIEADVVAAHTTEVPKKPYLRFTS